MKTVFDQLTDAYAKFYSQFKHLDVDEVIVLSLGYVIFKQYIPKKCKCFGIQIYKLCDTIGCVYNMSVYLGKDRQNATQTIAAIHVTMSSVTRIVEVVDQKPFMDNFFTSPDLFGDLHTRGISYCGTVRQNHKGITRVLDKKTLKLCDICARVRGHLTAMV